MDFGEEIPLLALDTPLNPADAPKFYEAFKEFDEQDTGFISISVNIIIIEMNSYQYLGTSPRFPKMVKIMSFIKNMIKRKGLELRREVLVYVIH